MGGGISSQGRGQNTPHGLQETQIEGLVRFSWKSPFVPGYENQSKYQGKIPRQVVVPIPKDPLAKCCTRGGLGPFPRGTEQLMVAKDVLAVSQAGSHPGSHPRFQIPSYLSLSHPAGAMASLLSLQEENRILQQELSRVEDLLAQSRAERDELAIKYNALSEQVSPPKSAFPAPKSRACHQVQWPQGVGEPSQILLSSPKLLAVPAPASVLPMWARRAVVSPWWKLSRPVLACWGLSIPVLFVRLVFRKDPTFPVGNLQFFHSLPWQPGIPKSFGPPSAERGSKLRVWCGSGGIP